MSAQVVDASVAVKWLVDEAHSDTAAQLLEDGSTLAAPELIFAEVANALWTLCRRGDLQPPDVHEAVGLLTQAPIAVSTPTAQLIPSASRLALDLEHPVYDCLYLALAMQLDCQVVTADLRFAEKVQAHPYLSARVIHLATF